jgi:hypothetical protein
MRIALIVLGTLSSGCVGTYSEADLAAHLDRVCPLVDLRSAAPTAMGTGVARVSLRALAADFERCAAREGQRSRATLELQISTTGRPLAVEVRGSLTAATRRCVREVARRARLRATGKQYLLRRTIALR